jgi:mono/diheme cytochrome c family protein
MGCSPAWAAADGAALYKSKCAQCHGPAGEGKKAMKGTAIKGSSASQEQIEQMLGNGVSGKKGPHGKAISGLNAEQVKALSAYVKTL